MVSHRAPGTPRRLWAVIAAGLVVLVGAVAFALTRSGSDATTPTASSSSSSTSTTPAGSSATSSSSSPSSSSPSSSSSSSSPAASASPAVAKAWSACTKQLQSGSALIDVTTKAANTWAMHYNAQILYDQHKISLARTRETWAMSKAAGFGEVQAVDKAASAYQKAGTPCDSLVSAVPSDQASAAKACAAKASALGAAVASGSKVSGDWAFHMHMMTSTDYHGSPAYLAKWHSLVKEAPAKRDAYDSDLKRYQQAPDCAAPQA